MTGRPERTGHVRDLTHAPSPDAGTPSKPSGSSSSSSSPSQSSTVRAAFALRYGPRKDASVLTGLGGPLLLNDGRFLRFDVSVYLDPHAGSLKTSKASYQYQLDRDGHQWICRYDYLREPGPDPHPQAHLQLRGFLEFDRDRELSRIHFPTGRGNGRSCDPASRRPIRGCLQRRGIRLAAGAVREREAVPREGSPSPVWSPDGASEAQEPRRPPDPRSSPSWLVEASPTRLAPEPRAWPRSRSSRGGVGRGLRDRLRNRCSRPPGRTRRGYPRSRTS